MANLPRLIPGATPAFQISMGQQHDVGQQKRDRVVQTRERKKKPEKATHWPPPAPWTCVYCQTKITNGVTHRCTAAMSPHD